MKEAASFKKSTEGIASSRDIARARKSFKSLSDTLAVVVKKFGISGKRLTMRCSCPMAFDDKGAEWLQNKEGT